MDLVIAQPLQPVLQSRIYHTVPNFGLPGLDQFTDSAWHPAIMIRPIDNLVSSEMIRFKRFVPSYERESQPSMAKIISHDYARIWQEDRKHWAKLSLPNTTKRSNVILLRQVVNPNLRKKQACPEKYRSKAEFRQKSNFSTVRSKINRNGIKKLNDCPDVV